ncbi:MAG: NADH-quinone oxidoreductase subunit B family protein [Burkholderiales bacterium]
MWQLFRQIVHAGIPTEAAPQPNDAGLTGHEHEHENEHKHEHEKIQADILAVLGRALCIREVDAGSCNACELEIQALSNPYYNIEGLGIKFVASPRHADMLMVTGPVSKNMEAALKLAYDAMPHPKLVVAIGECACTGGVFGESYASCGRVSNVIPVDVTVPGCPPPPIEILRGILTAISAKSQ